MIYNKLNDFEVRPRPVSAAGRALFLIEHPLCSPGTWDLLKDETRAWWSARAKPIADAAREDDQ